MELFIETSLQDLYFALIENNRIIAFASKENLVKKTDIFYDFLTDFLNDNHCKIQSLKSIYVTLGPGSFSGSRIGFLFARTVASLSNIKLFVAPTYKLFQVQKQLLNLDDHHVVIKANKYNVYDISFDKPHKILCDLKTNNGQFDQLNYSLFNSNISKYLSVFEQVNDLDNIELLYLHKPQIGGTKC